MAHHQNQWWAVVKIGTWKISGLATELVTSQHGVSSMERAACF